MAYEKRDSGTLRKNRRQRPDTKDAEYTGQCEIAGQRYWIDAWVREANGSKFFSLLFKPKDPPAAAPSSDQSGPTPPESDEPPF